jgi:Trypsin
MRMKRVLFAVASPLLVRALVGLAACGKKSTEQPEKSPPPSQSKSQDPTRRAILEYQTRMQEINRQRGRIAGGLFADPGQFPWQVALIKAGWNPKDGAFCGGSIVAPRWILTGAQGEDQDVFVGSVDLNNGGQILKVAGIYKHQRFRPLTFDNDVALLLLSADITSGQPIALLQPSEAPPRLAPRRFGRISGWGQVRENGPKSGQLKYIDVPFQDQSLCIANYRKDDPDYTVTPNMICAGYNNANEGDACGGDSGGPLIVPVDGTFKLAGVVSWGDGCSRAGLYGLYTRLVNYLPWIDEYITSSTTPIPGEASSTETSSVSPIGEAVSRGGNLPRADWMAHIDWSTTNRDAGGSTDCPSQYPYPGCILFGGRACLMSEAIASAKAGDCANAFRVTKVTQCHNPQARQSITIAGQDAVCGYLKTK